MYSKAIVRDISPNYLKCIRNNSLPVDLDKAVFQHKAYIKLLKELSLEVIRLSSLEYPDSCFVEDTAIIHKNNVYFPIMGAVSRRGENSQIIDILKAYKNVKMGTVQSMEGGDVLHFEDKLISGVTTRTLLKAITECSNLLNVKIDYVEDSNIVHLKSYVSKLNEKSILVSKQYQNHEVFRDFEKIIVPEQEIYASNVLEVNGQIIMPTNFPETQKLLKQAGFAVHTLETSEIAKCEGALTCLSLLF